MMIDVRVLLVLVVLALLLGMLIGGAIEFCQRGGTYDLRQELRASYRQSELLREELYRRDVLGTANHPAGRARVSVTSRPHLSLITNETGA